MRLIFGGALMVPFYVLLAAAFAFVTRNAGGAVAAVLAIMSAPALVGALPERWQEVLMPLLPASALHSLSGSALPDVPEYLSSGHIIVLVVWVAVALLPAYAALVRRDA